MGLDEHYDRARQEHAERNATHAHDEALKDAARGELTAVLRTLQQEVSSDIAQFRRCMRAAHGPGRELAALTDEDDRGRKSGVRGWTLVPEVPAPAAYGEIVASGKQGLFLTDGAELFWIDSALSRPPRLTRTMDLRRQLRISGCDISVAMASVLAEHDVPLSPPTAKPSRLRRLFS